MSKEKITEPGQPCRHCGTPVIKRVPRTKPRGNRKYYYEFFLRCSGCKRNYMVESAKKFWEGKSKLKGASPALLREANGKLALPKNDFPQTMDGKDGVNPSQSLPL